LEGRIVEAATTPGGEDNEDADSGVNEEKRDANPIGSGPRTNEPANPGKSIEKQQDAQRTAG